VTPRQRTTRIVLGLVSLLVFVVAVGGWGTSVYLTGNIHTSALNDGLGGQGSEKANAAGKTPMNILVIGSDARNNAEDLKIGGNDGGGANADVEMLVHLSANRTSATVLSIPRDTMTSIPACRDPNTGHVYPALTRAQINSSLARGGPGCVVATIHQLTGAVIDHFVMVDFAGVVSMSDAVGGVPVCVDNNVYDPLSQLKLSKGTHTLRGLAALEFLRTRHGFGDGSDLGREAAQHVFLSALIQKFKSGNTLANPATVLSLANAATRALTVDPGLAGTASLVGLAGQLNDVPTNQITFLTMPNEPDPAEDGRVLPAPGAQQVFQSIVNDQPVTGAPAAKPAPTAAPATVAPGTVQVTVENGSGITGRAATITDTLQAHGYSLARSGGNAAATATTRLTFTPTQLAAAQTVAQTLRLPASALSEMGSSSSLLLVIGSDWPSGTAMANSVAATTTTTPAALPSSANVLNAAATAGCVHVSTEATIGPDESPILAYSIHRNLPDSDSPSAPGM
jgi:LCP family protein required for cell wall assembly